MRYLLDTATLSNSFTMPGVLPGRINSLLEADEAKGFCSVSLLELAIHFRKGHLRVADLGEFFAGALALCLDSKSGGRKLTDPDTGIITVLCLDSKSGGRKLACQSCASRLKLCLDSKSGGRKLRAPTGTRAHDRILRLLR